MPIHNIELHRGRGGQICRSAGGAAQITASEGDFVTVKLPSSEIRRINRECYATIGQIGNTDHINIMLGKAGRNRWLGRRGISRGMARNPVDHPMGGGQGKSKGGGGWHHPVSPWGKLAKGGKTPVYAFAKFAISNVLNHQQIASWNTTSVKAIGTAPNAAVPSAVSAVNSPWVRGTLLSNGTVSPTYGTSTSASNYGSARSIAIGSMGGVAASFASLGDVIFAGSIGSTGGGDARESQGSGNRRQPYWRFHG